METARLGVWVAHGEGRFTFKDSKTLQKLKENGQVCVQYVDDSGKPTEAYPMNPNGSPVGVAALCSKDGRHFAMMPHPERCNQNWQWPYTMETDKPNKKGSSPWQRMFYNAYIWANKNQ